MTRQDQEVVATRTIRGLRDDGFASYVPNIRFVDPQARFPNYQGSVLLPSYSRHAPVKMGTAYVDERFAC
jgi:hypothetical protein